jgi:hypothetical protein
MPSAKKASRRRRSTPPIVAAVVQPVAKRLTRIEGVLLEVRNEQDVLLKQIRALQLQVDTQLDGNNGARRRISK